MKRLIYMFLLFLSINIFSSDWEFGVKAGLNYNHFEFQTGGYISKYIADYAFIDIYNETYGNYGKDRSEWNKLEDEFNSWDIGCVLGFGYRFHDFIFEFRYSRLIRDQNSKDYSLHYTKRLDYFDQYSFNIGYFF